MTNHICPQCGDHFDLEACEGQRECSVCEHFHNHAGCDQCGCASCPFCTHVHEDSEEVKDELKNPKTG